MALVNSLNFLPRVFRTTTNRRFLGATLDHLVSDSVNLPINGYIGRTFAPTYKLGDNYVPEVDAIRKNYQLEPSVVVTNKSGDIEFNTGYIDLLRNIENYGGLTNNQQRLFSSESYNYDGHFDYDKFVNYFNYYWLPNGASSINVYSNQAPYTADYAVTRNTSVNGYTFTGTGFQPNTQLTLVRGGTYTFTVNQPGSKFWIQRTPGVDGVDPNVGTLSTREIYGVSNNGEDVGTVTFRVPLYNAQDFYILMPIKASVDAAVTFGYTDIQNRLLSDFLTEFPDGLDGINNQLQNKNFVFITRSPDDSSWTTPTVAAPYTDLDVATIRPGSIIPKATRVNSWKIDLVAVDDVASDYIIQISPQTDIIAREKVFITSGKTYASQQYWLNDNLIYNTVPAITANMDYLYYQDSSNPGFVGQIKLIDNITTSIDVDADIIGQVGYTSPNGVVFTNGLKVQFDSLVTPSSYYKFEYSNYNSWVVAINNAGGTITGNSVAATAIKEGELIGEWDGTAGYRIREWYVEGVGTSITLVPVGQIIVPEDFSQYMETQADYITISRGSQDRNAWSRSNRWFHKDVIAATAKYNNTTEDYGPNLPGRRPIIEFEPNLQLFNYGIQAKNTVDLITFENTDAFGITLPSTRVEGQTSAIIDGITLEPGHRVVFANDYDLNVKNKIWEVTIIENLAGENFINLIPTDDNPVQSGENVLVTNGATAGRTYRFDGSNWSECQPKTALNQMPLFDLVDKDGYSFSDTTVYPDSTFAGNKIFNYYPGTGTNNDAILGFPLRYQNFNNIGDIVFKNYYDDDAFEYVTNTATGATTSLNCGTGYIIKNNGLTTQTYLNAWIKNKEPSAQYQLFTKFFDGRVIDVDGVNYAFVQIDALPTNSGTIPHLKVYKNNTLLVDGTGYKLTKYGVYDIVIFLTTPTIGDKLDVAVYSDTVSALAFYEVPKNLDQNPLNEKFSTIALGQIRTHYNKLIENTSASDRPLQDDYIKAQGGTLSQHSAPLVYAMTFLNDAQVNFVNGLDLAKKEYSRFKNKFISLCSTLPGLDYNDPISGVDAILQNINAVKNNSFPWYYSDMVPQGGNYTTLTYKVLNVRQTNYEITSIFNSSQLSNRAVLIWHNGTQLTLGNDYTFSTTVPAVIFNKTFAVGDTILIRDYFDTDGNFVPETPSKLGLYPKSEPTIYEDTTYQTPTQVIRGHDGSLTPAFGDFRDDFLLELEKRIYNNIKSDYTKNIINLYDILPGRFRNTEYSREEFTQILSKSFLQWSGTNNIDYTSNTWFDANNSWTWNYDQFTDSVDDKPLQGSWRAIYQYWYDTDQPNLAPWQMLGFGFKPSWWENRYGPAPYTSGNFTLWEDLEAGYVWNNGNAYTDARFARPGLTKFIPVDTAGNLLPPADTNIVKQYNISTAGNNFVVGQQGPVETAWRRSSDYPYAIQMALAMCKPASYFGTQYDTSRFYVNEVSTQFTDATNQKITPALLLVNGDTTTGTVLRTSGYVNWIADSIKNLGIDPVAKISSYLKNLTVKLNYKVGGFTDKNMLTVTAEQTAPGTTRAGVIIPDSNYAVYLNKSVPVATATYSAVIVQRTDTGYSVTGYDTNNPFFATLPSIPNSNAEIVTVDDATVKLFQDAEKTESLVPYGTTFTTIQQLSDFLVSYERQLTSVGFNFTQFDPDLQEARNFRTSVKEFLYWSQQGWETGTVIVLNPTANSIVLLSNQSVVDDVANTSTSGKILDQNFIPIKSANFNITRTESVNGNAFRITALDRTGICFARLHLVQYEHVLVFDNQSDFGDIIYIPSQGVRQYRLKLAGNKTGAFTGALSAAGYIYSTAQVNDWSAGTDYQVGDIVTFNNNYYTALSTIPATTKFDVANWAQIQEQDIKTGLLPSFGLQAQQFDSIYDVDHPPSNESLQLFSAGLIGFRPRSYLTDLGISIPNQTKFYQGYIKEKGSLNSITALTKANFNNVTGAIELFEEWGFKVGEYGDLDRNQFREFVLDQSIFTTNPVAFTSTTEFNAGNIIVNLNGNAISTTSNVYNSNNLSSTVTTLYNNRVDKFHIEDLPTAGPVYIGDTDLSIFNINTYFDSPDVAVGNKIWTAVDTNGTWNVYRVTETDISATQLTYTLDNYAQLQFDNDHSFTTGDLFLLKGFNVEYFNNAVLKNFNTNYDSVYQVINVVDTTTVTIQIHTADTLNNLIATSPVLSQGTIYKLVSAKISTIGDVDTIEPMDGWIENDRVWVENDGAPGTWGVYEYNVDTTEWDSIRSEGPKVDIASINRSFIYNKSTNNILAAIDLVDPAKGRILSSIDRDIDYKLQADPAAYNAGTVDIREDYHWGPDQVGRIWWNLDTVRYIDYEQDALIYRLNHWGDTFPGSSIDVYEWIESTVLPSQYVASGQSGVPLHTDDSAYSTYGYVDQSGNVKLKYYFWVTNRDEANTRAGKQNSVNAIVSAIENPQNQNIPYATVLRDDTIALYNIKNLLVGQNSVLHLGSRSVDAGLIHTEYALVQEKSAGSQIPANILSKLVDSLAGADAAGNPVPDPTLPPSQKYGIEIRVQEDRAGSAQTMFVNRVLALENYLALVNEKLLAYPVTQRKVLTILNSGESVPGVKSGAYRSDLVVGSIAERDYIDTALVSVDDSVLVTGDDTQLGKWSIYTWTGSAWTLSRVQSYKTDLYWSYANWYDASFDPTTTINITVPNNLEFGKLTLQPDTYIKVLNAGNDKFAIYYINSALERVTVGLEAGTIQIKDGTVPSKELRQILLSMQSEIFVDDLAQDFNEIFFAMIKFALTEQKNIDWAFKTSFISATQFIRKLEQFPSYISDNQDFYQTYINEVKPYRTILREFNINYQRNDQFSGDITDFDLAPYWDSNINVYRSPSGEQSYDDTLLNNQVYRDWKNNYTYSVVDVTVGMGGRGYILPPQIIITGGGGSGANAVAQINEFGSVTAITIVDAGAGYTSTPTVVINGTGSGAVATAVLRNVFDNNDQGHNVVRSIKTNIKFDRVTYDKKRPTEWANAEPAASGLTSSNAMVMWDEVTAGQVIAPYTWLNLNGTLWQMADTTHTVSEGLDFPINDVSTTKPLSAGTLQTANDRIVAYYGNIDLSATASGLDYPGVIVDGSNYFAYDTVTAWAPNTAVVAGSEISYNNEIYVVNGNVSAPTFADIAANVTQVSAAKIDAIIQSRFADNLGIDAGNIYVDGGKYVDTFSSHAPEELIPGRVYDSLNLQVFADDYAFRLFDNMNQQHKFYRISDDNTTTLVEDLMITDTEMSVADATRLPNPNRTTGIPGEVFINGEKIVYYRNYSQETMTPWASNTVIAQDSVTSFDGLYYLTTGNVFAINIEWTPNTVFAANSYVYYSGNSYQITGNVNAPLFTDIVANTALMYNNEDSGFASVAPYVKLIGNSTNVLGQLRRAVDGTAPNSDADGTLVHSAGTRVVDASALQTIPLATATDAVVDTTTVLNVTANVTLKLNLTTGITANVGDFILKKNLSTTLANLRVLDSVVNSANVAAMLISGTLSGTTGNTVSVVNGQTGSTTGTPASILTHAPAGQVDGNGNVTVVADTVVTQSNIWYGDISGYSYGDTLSNSTTYQATFLKASPGFLP